MVFTFGTTISYGILREPFSAAFDVAPIELSSAFALMLFAFFIGSGLVGVFGVRFPARGVLLVCTVVTGVLAPSLYFVDSIVGLAVVFVALGVALGTVVVMVASVVPRWFETRRGAATGLIFTGNGVGLFVLPPVWQHAIAEYGVRRGFLIVVAVTATAFLLVALVCRRPPWAEQSSASTGDIVGWLARLGRTRTFQLLFVGIALSFAWYQLLAGYAVDLFVARGFTDSGASTAFGLIGGFSIISRVGGGYLSDRMGSRRAFLASLVCVVLGTCLLFLSAVPGLLVAIFLLGLGLGGTATIYLPLIMSTFSPEKDTAIVGVFNVGGGIAALAMPPLGTASITYTGGFTLAILLTLVVTLGGLWTVAAGTTP
ncbi:MFS transporter [Halorubellus sp. JP-L1]|uniref:MFS transporter n=1 Tax=Halorubellus sp. JP-L1 TaxID=2715753 RepID=UPI0018786064|nr:MFS transporter [Halorubellus sp. JP-L1]